MTRISLGSFFFAGTIAVTGCATGFNDNEFGGGAGGVGTSSSGTKGSTATSATSGGPTTSGVTSSTSVTSGNTTSTSVGSTTSSAQSSVASSTVTTGAGMCPTGPSGTMGCTSCGACDNSQWPVTWNADASATYYVVEYTCIIPFQYTTMSTTVDLCNQVGMCNQNFCGNGVASVTVQACNATCCGAKMQVPSAGIPAACGGGVCC